MTKFNRRVRASWMTALSDQAQHKGWWRELLDYRYKGVDGGMYPLALAVRDGYLNAYVEGQSVLKIKFDNAAKPIRLQAEIHHKYLKMAVGQEYKIFDGVMVDNTPYIPGLSIDCWTKRAQTYALAKSAKNCVSEKQGIAVIVGQSPNVIDLEMALPASATDRPVADRIDIVALERAGSAINIVFYEAKLFSNKRALRAKNGQPTVLEQLDRYEAWLTSDNRIAEVIDAYRETCRLLVELREMQGIPVDELIMEASIAGSNLQVDPRPRLIVFGYDGSKSDPHWLPHQAVLRRADLDQTRFIMEPRPEDVRLSRGTFPDGYIDEAEDILASVEGSEMVEKMNGCVRHHKLSAIAHFAPVFTRPDFRFAARYEEMSGLVGTAGAPRPHLSESAREFVETACGSGWVELADWRTWASSQEARDLNGKPARIATASEDQLGKLLTAHIRKDRFEAGALNSAFEAGVITAIVQRAEALLRE